MAGIPNIRLSSRVNARANRDPMAVITSAQHKKDILVFCHKQWADNIPPDRADIFERFYYYKPRGMQVMSPLARDSSKQAFYITEHITMAPRGATLADCITLHREGPSLVSSIRASHTAI